MWMNGSRSRRSTPAKARRTGKPSPSKPDGAVVTDRVRRRTVPGAGSGTRGRVVVSSTVTAGIAGLLELRVQPVRTVARRAAGIFPRQRTIRIRRRIGGMDDAAGRLGCPKRMVFGPCGGVREDGRCEVAEHPCVFLDGPPVEWTEVPQALPVPAPGGLLARALHGPVVLADLTVRPDDPASVRRVVEALAPAADAVLAGEHADAPGFPPTMVAAEVLEAGGRLWTTLTCRDRNRVVLEQELTGLAALGVDGVLCVTGDA